MKLSRKINLVVFFIAVAAMLAITVVSYYSIEKVVNNVLGPGSYIIGTYELIGLAFPLALVVIAASLLLLRFLRKIIIRPLKELNAAVSKITEGDLVYRIEMDGHGELQDLGNSFNLMADKLAEVKQKLTEEVKAQTSTLSDKLHSLEDIKLATINILEDLNEDKTKIEESRAKDEAVLASIGDGLVVTDNDLNVLLLNEQAERLLGWQKEEIIGKSWLDFVEAYDDTGKLKVHKNDLPLYIAVKKGQKVTRDDLQHLRKDKSMFPTSITAAPIVFDGEIVGAVLVFRDVTHEKEVDRAKTEFVSLASHQLRTPLSAINWYAEMLIAGDAGKLNEDQVSYLKEIYESNQRMVGLVDALLNVSRIDLGTFAMDPEPTNILEICDSVITELQPQIISKKLNVTKNYAQNIPTINSDPKLLRIVFQNLLSNSVKYTPDQGQITVSVSTDDKCLNLLVADTGYGIPKRQQSKLFTKLFRADNVMEKATDGTGLGLYIVKSIVEQSGGQISFQSEENQGTTFNVSLPLIGMQKKIGTKTLT